MEMKNITKIRNLKEKIEKHIGRNLKENEITHHIDGNQENNNLNNIYIFNSTSEHISYHSRVMQWGIKLNVMNQVDSVKYINSFPKLISNLSILAENYENLIERCKTKDGTIVFKKVRILKPLEYEKIEKFISKNYLKTIFNIMLFTGMRYVEIKRFHENKDWFNGSNIILPKREINSFRRQKERIIKLNEYGILWTLKFMNFNGHIPTMQNMGQNMKRWSQKVKIKPDNITIKTMRMTWFCWLLKTYPKNTIDIFNSLGFNYVREIKQLKEVPFDVDNINLMKEYTKNWL